MSISLPRFLQAVLCGAIAVSALGSSALALTREQRGAYGAVLQRAGITLDFKEDCGSTSLVGRYDPADRTLTVCMDVVMTAADPAALADETIAHETVHAAQHCLGRKLGMSGMVPLQLAFTDDADLTSWWINYVNRNTVGKQRELGLSSAYNKRGITPTLEREAYALEGEPELVFKYFRAVCLGE